MMPLWTMTLGRLVHDGLIVVPYRNIATLAGGLVIPLMVHTKMLKLLFFSFPYLYNFYNFRLVCLFVVSCPKWQMFWPEC